jgi:hypothetical protein
MINAAATATHAYRPPPGRLVREVEPPTHSLPKIESALIWVPSSPSVSGMMIFRNARRRPHAVDQQVVAFRDMTRLNLDAVDQ